jgi:hypothetical protein
MQQKAFNHRVGIAKQHHFGCVDGLDSRTFRMQKNTSLNQISDHEHCNYYRFSWCGLRDRQRDFCADPKHQITTVLRDKIFSKVAGATEQQHIP